MRRRRRDRQGPPGTWRWRERAVQWLDFPLGRFLDYGCGSCGLLEIVRERCAECHGVDVNTDVIRKAQESFPDFKLATIGVDGSTACPDDYFDTVAIVEVIEHVPDERATLAEIARILKPGGKLLLTTPHRGLLTFLDVGNFKFVLPGLHRFIHLTVLRNRAYFEQRFVRTREMGLVGDISVGPNRRPWHRHYKPRQIQQYCPGTLQLHEHGVYFPGMRALMLLAQIIRVVARLREPTLPWPLSALERSLSRLESPAGDQLVMLFVKGDADGEDRPAGRAAIRGAPQLT